MKEELHDLTLTTALLIDIVCDRFEEAYGSRSSPRIEDYLGELGEPMRSQLLREVLRIEIECRVKSGQHPAVDEYLHRFPNQQFLIEELIAAIPVDQSGPYREVKSTQTLSNETRPETNEPVSSDDYDRPKNGLYEVLRQHAEGGLGTVSIARDRKLNREVALKDIQSRLSGDPDSRARFIAEAEITGGLEHPGIVPVYALDRHEDGRPYYVMRFVRGQTLHEAIKSLHTAGGHDNIGRMPSLFALRKLLRRFLDVCNTVAYAHNRQVVHRDLKPQNILLGPYGETLIIDWGLAKTLGSADQQGAVEGESAALMPSSPVQTEIGRIAGTPGYMSPEQADGHVAFTTACDIYSLGATLYCLLTGRTPRIDSDKSAQLESARREGFEGPRRLVPKLPRALEAICNKSMRVDPAERYDTATELAADVEAWLEDEPVSCHRERPLERFGRWTRKNRSWVGVAGAALALIAVIAIISTITVDRSRRSEAIARDRATENLQTSLDAIDKMLTSVGDEKLIGIPQLTPVRQALLDDALMLLESIHDRQPTDRGVKHRLARVRIRVGQLAAWTGDHQRALEVLTQAQTAVDQLQEEFPDGDRYANDLMQIVFIRSWVYQDRSQFKLAEQTARQGIELFGQLPQSMQQDPEKQFGRAQNLGNLAYALSRQDQFKDAEFYFRQSDSLFKQLQGKVDMSANRYQTAAMLINFGNLLKQTGNITESHETYSEALTYCEQLVAADQVYPNERQLMARVCDQLATLVLHQHGPREAERISRRTIEQWERLTAEYPSVAKFQYELALSSAALAYYISQPEKKWTYVQRVAYLKTRKDEIDLLFTQSTDILTTLAEEHPDVPVYQEVLANTYNSQGIFRWQIGDQTAAIEAFSRVVETQKSICKRLGETPDRVSLLGGALNNLAKLVGGEGDLTGARDMFLQAITCQEKALAANAKNPTYRSYLRNHYMGLAIVYALIGSSERALEATTEYERIARQLYQDHGDVADYRIQLNSACVRLAFQLADATSEGVENFEKARDLIEEAVARSPHWRFYQVVLAEIECRLGNLTQAQQAIEKARTLAPDDEDLAYELFVEALLFWRQGNPTAASETFKKFADASATLSKKKSIDERYSAFRLERLRAEIAEILGSRR